MFTLTYSEKKEKEKMFINQSFCKNSHIAYLAEMIAFFGVYVYFTQKKVKIYKTIDKNRLMMYILFGKSFYRIT